MKYIIPVILAVNTALSVLAFLLVDIAQDAAIEPAAQELWTLFGYVFVGGAVINFTLFLFSFLAIVRIRRDNEPYGGTE